MSNINWENFCKYGEISYYLKYKRELELNDSICEDINSLTAESD